MGLTINHNASLFRLLTIMNNNEAERQSTMTRLATGKRINRGSDDPAGLIAVKSLGSELAAVNAGIDNNQRTKSMLDVVDGALTEITSLVSDLERLAVAAVGDTLSTEEKAANQAQIDSIIDSIDRIVNTSTFNNKPVFGGANQIAATMTASAAADIKDLTVYSRNPNQSSVSLSVNVTAAATRASTSGTSIANITASLSAATTVTIAGKDGTATLTFASGSTLNEMVSTINNSSGLTGVSAAASGTQLRLDSTDFGSESFVSITALSGDQDVTGTANTGKLEGEDATIVVNGQSAMTSGKEFYYNGNGVSFGATLDSNTTGTRTITINGGGATFQLGTDSGSRATIAIPSLTTATLGRSDLGYLSDLRSGGTSDLNTDANQAVTIAKEAVQKLASVNARIGGFMKHQVDASINSLSAAKESLSSAISTIEDADIAVETSNLERQNLLANTTVALLGIANSQHSNVLSLLLG